MLRHICCLFFLVLQVHSLQLQPSLRARSPFSFFRAKTNVNDELPTRAASDPLLNKKDTSHSTCSICLEDYTQQLPGVVLIPCGHKFHSGCISKWRRRSNRCPLCNQIVTGTSADAQSQPSKTPRRKKRRGGSRRATRSSTPRARTTTSSARMPRSEPYTSPYADPYPSPYEDQSEALTEGRGTGLNHDDIFRTGRDPHHAVLAHNPEVQHWIQQLRQVQVSDSDTESGISSVLDSPRTLRALETDSLPFQWGSVFDLGIRPTPPPSRSVEIELTPESTPRSLAEIAEIELAQFQKYCMKQTLSIFKSSANFDPNSLKFNHFYWRSLKFFLRPNRYFVFSLNEADMSSLERIDLLSAESSQPAFFLSLFSCGGTQGENCIIV